MHTDIFIDGLWRASADTFPVHNPATGEVLAQVADAGESDSAAALTAAAAVQGAWATTAPQARADLLMATYRAMVDRGEELARIMTLEMGKSLAESRAEVTYAANFVRWFAAEATRIGGEFRTSPDGSRRILITRRPVGPSLLITPWNFPLAMAARKVAPALAAGCTTIIKPAQLTPLTTLAFASILTEVGVPAGVVNVLPSSRAAKVSQVLLRDGRLRKLSFTGSTAVGRDLQAQAGQQLLRTSMEMGGNAPFLVFADADLDQAVAGLMQAKFRNIGQACTAANRILVAESVADKFVEKFVAAASQLRLGDGLNEGTDLGPLISESARAGVHALVADARAHGARVLLGGQIPQGPGYFYPATVLIGAGAGARIHHEEIFGPVASISTFTDREAGVAAANSSPYGLASYAYTGDLTWGLQLVEQLEFGLVGLNAGVISDASAPFGGLKDSGLGREGGLQGIEEYQEVVYAGIGGFPAL